MSPNITVVVNGETRQTGAQSLEELIESLTLDPRMLVVEHNRNIVRAPQLAKTPVHDGDVIELVHFVGGG